MASMDMHMDSEIVHNDNMNNIKNLDESNPDSKPATSATASVTQSAPASVTSASTMESKLKEILNQLQFQFQSLLGKHNNTNSNNKIIKIIKNVHEKFNKINKTNPYLSYFITSTSTAIVLYLFKRLAFSSIIYFVIHQLYQFVMRIVGTTVGIGLGLGLAFHIRELLDEASINHHYGGDIGDNSGIDNNGIDNERNKVLVPKRTSSSSGHTASIHQTHSVDSTASPNKLNNNGSNNNHKISGQLSSPSNSGVNNNNSINNNNNNNGTSSSDDSNTSSYHTLMANAGYAIPKNLLHGQIIRNISSSDEFDNYAYCNNEISKRNSLYRFPKVKDAKKEKDNENEKKNDDNDNDHLNENNSKGQSTFARMWPDLPKEIHQELGTVVDYILRDYVSSWYAYVDGGVQYEDAKIQKQKLAMEERQQRKKKRNKDEIEKDHFGLKRSFSASSSTTNNTTSRDDVGSIGGLNQEETNDNGNSNSNRKNTNTAMVLSTAAIKTIPFLEILYTSLTALFGNLSMYVGDNINVPELVLIKLVHILKVNIRTYRNIRKAVLAKDKEMPTEQSYSRLKKSSSADSANNENAGNNGSSIGNNQGTNTGNNPSAPTTDNKKSSKFQSVSEIAMIREYLVQGKLHKAITFGMDVPGLLFGDMNGEACPPPNSYEYSPNPNNTDDANVNNTDQTVIPIADQILNRRIFGNKSRLLYECELDYNRVLSHRIARILFPRADFNSPVLRSAVVEMLAGCVITPIMGCATPDYINGLINTALEDAGTAQADGDLKNTSEIFEGEDSEHADNEDDDQDVGDDILEHTDDEQTIDDDGDYGDDATHDDEIVIETAPLEQTMIGISNSTDVTYMDPSDEILALLSMALIDIGAHVDYEDARIARENGDHLLVDWNNSGCKEVVRNLVLVIESVLIHGLLNNYHNKDIGTIDEDKSENDTEHSLLVSLLMEVTSDLESFENKVNTSVRENIHSVSEDEFETDNEMEIHLIPKPSFTDLATLRTLIAAWLNTGLVYRTLSVLLQCGEEFLAPFYHKEAFILDKNNSTAFLRQLQTLHGIELIVDTSTVISCPPLDLFQLDNVHPSSFFPPPLEAVDSGEQQNDATITEKSPGSGRILKLTKGLQPKRIPDLGRSIKANFENKKKKLTSLVRVGVSTEKGSIRQNLTAKPRSSSLSLPAIQESPSHLKYRKNEVFATSLRNERESRMNSFLSVFTGPRTNLEMICRSRVSSEAHFLQHRDLHNIAKCFYSNTNALILKSESRKEVSNENDDNEAKMFIQSTLVLETVASRRKTSIPEDDSSFLLRAQPSPLNIVNIHRDQRSHSLSYKKYAAYYDEPILHVPTKTNRGGRLRRKCFLRYYPNDRTASITFIQHDRRVDYRNKDSGRSCISTEGIDMGNRPKEFERHSCYKAIRKGTERTSGTLANSILASTLMDSTDFSNVPRSGKAVDFLYRMNLFEEPAIELSGKRLIVQDATAIGCHQADASALELSDASLSIALTIDSNEEDKQFYVKCDSYNSPLVFMKVIENAQNSPSGEKKNGAVYRSFRISYVRAALLITSSRKEALLKCLLYSIRSGSAKRATKARMDAFLQMPLFLLECATSKKREKQSILLRDLKLGINHVDRDQLRRNGIWNPRYPTQLKQVKVKVEDAIEVKANNVNDLLGQTTILYKIRCIVITEYIGVHNNDTIDRRHDGTIPEYGDLFHEEWIVWRPFRDFGSLHKVLKSIVNPSESSAGTGAKLVGAATGLATAALTIGNSSVAASNPEFVKRKALVPSLSQAAKVGALGSTRKSIAKRMKLLNSYLNHLLASNNLLNRCPELLRFVGAYDPLPLEVKLDQAVIPDFTDALGRRDMYKSLLHGSSMKNITTSLSPVNATAQEPTNLQNIVNMLPTAEIANENIATPKKRRIKLRKKEMDPKKTAMLESIRSRIERVKLSEVRVSIFDLIRYTFDLDNASFFRNRMVAALKTMSFALTSGQGFKKTLLNIYMKYLTGKSIASYVKYLREKLWPGGVIFTSAPELTLQEKQELMQKSSKLLHQAFPDQLSALLGQENTDNGIDILHEMLQNRVVLKSISYMMVDALLLEVFPEIGDVLTCSNMLDYEEE